MKKFLLGFWGILFLAIATSACSAASLYTTTINDTNISTVQDVSLEVMTGKNFTIDEVTPYKIVFTKSFGDGFWTASKLCYVLFNFIERDGNVKLMVSETEKIGAIQRKRGIDHLVPLVKKIKSAVDGTPEGAIGNEAKNQLPGSGNKREKVLGLKLGKVSAESLATVQNVEPGSLAADAGIFALDKIEEVNGRSVSGMTLNALNSYLANKMAAKSSIMLVLSRGNEKILVSIKAKEE